MGAPFSALLSQIFLQPAESENIIKLSPKHNNLGHFRYVDNILVIYDSEKKDINLFFTDFNQIHTRL
jgi:hypothetical protein